MNMDKTLHVLYSTVYNLLRESGLTYWRNINEIFSFCTLHTGKSISKENKLTN